MFQFENVVKLLHRIIASDNSGVVFFFGSQSS